MTIFIQAVQNLCGGPHFKLFGDDAYENIAEWFVDTPPTKQQVEAEVQRLINQAPLDACKAKAKTLLANTDWAVLPDVNLTNKTDFETYRATLRNLVLNPVSNPNFPTEPTPNW
jgi:hypothetical protein